MKKLALFLLLLPFLAYYANSNTFAKKANPAGNSVRVNFSSAASELNYNFIMPDTTSDTSITSPDTVIKG
jgi:hypothetical protein